MVLWLVSGSVNFGDSFGEKSSSNRLPTHPKSLGYSFGRETTDIDDLHGSSLDSEVVCVALERGYDVLNAIQRDQPDP